MQPKFLRENLTNDRKYCFKIIYKIDTYSWKRILSSFSWVRYNKGEKRGRKQWRKEWKPAPAGVSAAPDMETACLAGSTPKFPSEWSYPL